MTTSNVTGPILAPDLTPQANTKVTIMLVTGGGNIGHYATGEILGKWEARTDPAGDFTVELPWNTEILPSGTYYAATVGRGDDRGTATFVLDPASGIVAGGSYHLMDPMIVVVGPPAPAFIRYLPAPSSSLALATSQAPLTSIGTTAVQIPGMSITFAVPVDRPVIVRATLPKVGANVLNEIITVQMRDGAGTTKATSSYRGQTSGGNYSDLTITEAIAAGAGTVTRELWAVSTGSTGFVNTLGDTAGFYSFMALEAYAR